MQIYNEYCSQSCGNFNSTLMANALCHLALITQSELLYWL